MYARTSFRGAKTCKIGKKGMFLVILTNFWMDMMLKLRKTLAKTGSFELLRDVVVLEYFVYLFIHFVNVTWFGGQISWFWKLIQQGLQKTGLACTWQGLQSMGCCKLSAEGEYDIPILKVEQGLLKNWPQVCSRTCRACDVQSYAEGGDIGHTNFELHKGLFDGGTDTKLWKSSKRVSKNRRGLVTTGFFL